MQAESIFPGGPGLGPCRADVSHLHRHGVVDGIHAAVAQHSRRSHQCGAPTSEPATEQDDGPHHCLALDTTPQYSIHIMHTERDKKKIINRIRRIRGQLNALEKAVEQEQECIDVLQTLAACRGALNGLLAEIVEGHVEHHLVDARGMLRSEAAAELVDVVRAYFK